MQRLLFCRSTVPEQVSVGRSSSVSSQTLGWRVTDGVRTKSHGLMGGGDEGIHRKQTHLVHRTGTCVTNLFRYQHTGSRLVSNRSLNVHLSSLTWLVYSGPPYT